MDSVLDTPLTEAEKDALIARHGGPRGVRIFLTAGTLDPASSPELRKAFAERLAILCRPDTSSDSGLWSMTNPFWGHCAIVALLAQEKFGGTIVRQSLEYVPIFSRLGSHYSNMLPDGTKVDFTVAQFNGALPPDLPLEKCERMYLLANPETLRRYTLLRERLQAKLLEPTNATKTRYFPESDLEIGIPDGGDGIIPHHRV